MHWRAGERVWNVIYNSIHFWPPRHKTARYLWKEVSRYWSMRLIADFDCLVRRYWKPIYKAFIWRARVGGPVSFVNTVPRYFDWHLKQLVKVWMTPLISLDGKNAGVSGVFSHTLHVDWALFTPRDDTKPRGIFLSPSHVWLVLTRLAINID